MQRLGLLTAVAFALLGTAASSARAQQPNPADDQRARVHFQAGSQYYDDGRYEEAIPEFREAYRLSHRTEMLLNLANAAEHALQPADAASALEQYLAAVPNAPDHEALERRLTRNREAAARMAAQTTGGGTGGATGTAGAGDAHTDAATDAHPTMASPLAPGRGMSGLTAASLVTLGIGVAVGVTSLILGLVANDQYATLEAACPMHVCTTDRSADASSGKTLALASTVLTFVALAAGVAGGVMLALGLGEHSDARATGARLELTPGPGELGVGARVRW